ncbi:MAG TPA: TlpA disulfide reductase family protein [Opitutaceae bacterium]|nr:TlpA disulfide reductase family protein [Opitutaceae bacterium]
MSPLKQRFQILSLRGVPPGGTTKQSSWIATSASAVARFAHLAVLLASLMGAGAAQAQIKSGDAFPSLADAGLSGGAVPATAGQVVLVDFWASWCAPCKASFPAMARLHADYGSRGLVIVAVSVDDKPAAYETFVKKLAPPFVTVLDGGKKLVREVKAPAMPTSYLIGRDGKVRFVHPGFHGDETDRQLRQQIDALLAEKI